jgi:hypothetical protein
MTKPIQSAVRGQDPSKTSPCSRCQHAEFIHAYAGPCLFHDCECPFFIRRPSLMSKRAGGERSKNPAPNFDLARDSLREYIER